MPCRSSRSAFETSKSGPITLGAPRTTHGFGNGRPCCETSYVSLSGRAEGPFVPCRWLETNSHSKLFSLWKPLQIVLFMGTPAGQQVLRRAMKEGAYTDRPRAFVLGLERRTTKLIACDGYVTADGPNGISLFLSFPISTTIISFIYDPDKFLPFLTSLLPTSYISAQTTSPLYSGNASLLCTKREKQHYI